MNGKATNKIHWLDSVSVRPRWYTGFGRGAGSFNFCFGKNEVRVELYFSSDQEKKYFDSLINRKGEVENIIPGIVWQRMSAKKASRIKLTAKPEVFPGKSIYNREDHQAYVDWFREAMGKFHKVMLPHLERTLSEVKRIS